MSASFILALAAIVFVVIIAVTLGSKIVGLFTKTETERKQDAAPDKKIPGFAEAAGKSAALMTPYGIVKAASDPATPAYVIDVTRAMAKLPPWAGPADTRAMYAGYCPKLDMNRAFGLSGNVIRTYAIAKNAPLIALDGKVAVLDGQASEFWETTKRLEVLNIDDMGFSTALNADATHPRCAGYRLGIMLQAANGSLPPGLRLAPVYWLATVKSVLSLKAPSREPLVVPTNLTVDQAELFDAFVNQPGTPPTTKTILASLGYEYSGHTFAKIPPAPSSPNDGNITFWYDATTGWGTEWIIYIGVETALGNEVAEQVAKMLDTSGVNETDIAMCTAGVSYRGREFSPQAYGYNWADVGLLPRIGWRGYWGLTYGDHALLLAAAQGK